MQRASNQVRIRCSSYGMKLKKRGAHFLRLLDETFANAWSRNNQLIKVDPLLLDSVVVSAAHIVRGNCSIEDLKRNVERYV